MHRHLKIPSSRCWRSPPAALAPRARGQRQPPTDRRRRRPEARHRRSASTRPRPRSARCPAALAPAYGQKALSEGEWRFDFHGFLIAPLVASIGVARPPRSTTPMPCVPGQSTPRCTRRRSSPTISRPSRTPAWCRRPTCSSTSPRGTASSPAHASMLARQANVSTSFIEPASQLGVTDLFLSVLPRLQSVRTEVFVGAFASRYGTHRRVRRGALRHAAHRARQRRRRADHRCGSPWARLVLMAEEGLVGQTNKANAATTPDVWNDFANSERGRDLRRPWPPGPGYDRLAPAGPALPRGLEPGRPRHRQRWPPTATSTIYAADLRMTTGALRLPLRAPARTPTPSGPRPSAASSAC